MSEEKTMTQRKFGVWSQYRFEAKQLDYTLRDYSGELQFSVPYEAIDTAGASTLLVNNLRLLRILAVASLLAIFVIASVIHVGRTYSAGMAIAIGVWLATILLVRSLRLLAIRYTILPVPAVGKRLRIIVGRNHDAILDEIRARWRVRIRELYGSINFGSDSEKELARFSWMKQHAVITEGEYQAIVEKLRTYAMHNRAEPTEQRLN